MKPCNGHLPKTRPGNVKRIRLDPEFARFLPPPAAEEQRQIEEALLRDGCRTPLIVWPFETKQVLVVGYLEFPILRLRGLPFRVIEHPFGSREEARAFLIKHALAQSNRTPLAVSYLRGLRYHDEKSPHGGDRKSSEARRACSRLLAADVLAMEFSVSPATIRRDGAVAEAVNTVMANCGEDAKGVLLSPGGRLSRSGVLALAKLSVERQRSIIEQLRSQEGLGRSWRSEDRAATITLPCKLNAMARKLVQRLRRRGTVRLLQRVAQLIGADDRQIADLGELRQRRRTSPPKPEPAGGPDSDKGRLD